jgi:hypothetical protein
MFQEQPVECSYLVVSHIPLHTTGLFTTREANYQSLQWLWFV